MPTISRSLPKSGRAFTGQPFDTNAADSPLISRLEIEALFYSYSYDIRAATDIGPESGKLLLLYGNNGAGKTTILNLIFHLLHPEPFGGHRSYIGKIPFKFMRIHLGQGVVVSAIRQKSPEPGPYTIQVNDAKGQELVKWSWHPDKSPKTSKDEKYDALCQYLHQLHLTFHYLRDTRRVEGGANLPSSRIRRRVIHGRDEIEMHLVEEIDDQELTSPEKHLTQTIENAIQWFRQQALVGTNVGYTSVNSLYTAIIKRIIKFGSTSTDMEQDTRKKLEEDLIALRTRNSQFAEFGLTPDLDIEEILESLRIAEPEHADLLRTVLSPYLEGHSARLNALQELQRIMDSFVSLLADFYSHKQVTVHLEKGLEISAITGQSLPPSALSSGERQLLLLFCNAISARRDRTILMIDEPEISLNVKWQRQLIPALLTCMSGTSFQIILATHSVELLSRYREFVSPLDNIQGARDSV